MRLFQYLANRSNAKGNFRVFLVQDKGIRAVFGRNSDLDPVNKRANAHKWVRERLTLRHRT